MSLPDPLTVAFDPPVDVPRINSAPGSSTYRTEFPDGAVARITFYQSGTKTRQRHVAKLEHSRAPTSDGVVNSLSVTISIDEPISNVYPNADVLYLTSALKDTLTDAIINRMSNQEL